MSNYSNADNRTAAELIAADTAPATLADMHTVATRAIAAEDAAEESARAYLARGNDADMLTALVSALDAHSARRALGDMLTR